MRRPSADAGWTLLVLVILLAGVGFAMAAGQVAPDAGAPPTTPGPSTPATPSPPTAPSDDVPAEPSTPAPTRRPGASQTPSATTPAPALPSATASACPALARELTLRVLTLNTHGGHGPSGFDMNRLSRFIRAADVDVALLQEVDRDRPRSHGVDMPRVLAEATGMDMAYGLNVHLGPRRGVSGIATLSRYPITATAHTLLPNRPGLKQRGLLRTDLDVDGTTVSVFNTHLEHTSPAMRFRQLAALRGPLAASGHPVVLGGDLNAGSGSDALRLARTFLDDAWTAAGSGAGATAPAHSPRVRIDYLLYAPPLQVTRAEVLPAVVSDHRGVRGRFVLSVADREVCVPELDGAVGSGDG